MNTETKDLRVVGVGMTRTIFVNGEHLDPKERKFDWGFNGTDSQHLSNRIIEEYLDGEIYARDLHKLFTIQLPPINFDATFKIDKLLEWSKNEPKKKRTSHALMTLNVAMYTHVEKEKREDLFIISKFLDFPYNNIRNAILGNGTIEYDMMRKMQKLILHDDNTTAFDVLGRYYQIVTKTINAHNPNEIAMASIEYDHNMDAFIYKNGLGSIKGFTGHNSDEYAI